MSSSESNTAMIVGVAGVFHLLALIFTCLRVYARMTVVKTFRREDYVILTSTVGVPIPYHIDLCVLSWHLTPCSMQIFALGGLILLILLGQHGIGKHIDTISSSDTIMRTKLDFFMTIVTNIGLCLLKTSIALSLLALITNSHFSTGLHGVFGL